MHMGEQMQQPDLVRNKPVWSVLSCDSSSGQLTQRVITHKKMETYNGEMHENKSKMGNQLNISSRFNTVVFVCKVLCVIIRSINTNI